MSEMIDRVAMALCVGSGRNPHEKIEGDVHTFGHHPIDFNAATVDMITWDFRWKIFRRHARLAIEAMREPTSDMVRAAKAREFEMENPGKKMTEVAWRPRTSVAMIVAHHQAMIDEALKD